MTTTRMVRPSMAEPWQMPLDRFLQSGWTARRTAPGVWDIYRPDGFRWGFVSSGNRRIGSSRTALKVFHEHQVRMARSQRWAVPAQVLAEYPCY